MNEISPNMCILCELTVLTLLIGRNNDKKILISDIIEFSAFFSGCYTAYEINSICTMYKLCLLITVNILFNVKHKLLKDFCWT